MDKREVLDIATSEKRAVEFTDTFVDTIVEKAAHDEDEVIRALALSVCHRHPPKLIKEVLVLKPRGERYTAGSTLYMNCRSHLRTLAEKYQIPLGQFLLCETPPLEFDKRGSRMTLQEAKALQEEGNDDLIRIFAGNAEEPIPLVDINRSLAHICSNWVFRSYRLYLVQEGKAASVDIDCLRDEVKDWDKPPTT